MKSKRTPGMSAMLGALMLSGGLSPDAFKEIPRPTRTSKRSGPLAEQPKANAAAKRERKAKKRIRDYESCLCFNDCLVGAGKNFITAGNRPC